MSGDQKSQGVPRQRPVSCRFCRQRKLRCSRDAPCSNCVSRGMRCELGPPPPASVPGPASTKAADTEIVERLRKLEALVESQRLEIHRQPAASPESSSNSAPPPFATPSSTPAEVENVVNDVARLESTYDGAEGSLNLLQSTTIVFKICPFKHMKHSQQWITQDAQYNFLSSTPTRCIWLPQYAEAKILLEKFIKEIDHLHHVTYTPSLPSILDEFYGCLNQHGVVKPGNAILLLGIFASCCQAWVRQDCENDILSTEAEANELVPMWIKAVEDVLDNAHRTTSMSIEGIQGVIITSFTVGNIEGISRRCRSLWNMSIQLGRELGLHCLDHPNISNSFTPAEKEIGRRVWWYLVALDWTTAIKFAGSPRGVYLCNPRQMLVNMPLHINDEDVKDDMELVEKPRSQPTDMSYLMHRLRLAEICRAMTDRTPMIMGNNIGSNHDIVMDIDTQMLNLLNEVPAFFSMSISEIVETYGLTRVKATAIVHQGYMLYAILHAQRCRLHLPFFSRGFADPAFASSKDICVRSALLVIQTETRLDESEVRLVARYKYLGLLLSVFIASAVLLMDLCHNKSTPQHETQRREVAQAFRILEAARHESHTVANFLDSLIQILHKHKVAPPTAPQRAQSEPDNGQQHAGVHNYAAASAVQPSSDVDMVPSPANTIDMMRGLTNSDNFSSYFNDLAQSFEHGIDVNTFNWDTILSGLEPSYM